MIAVWPYRLKFIFGMLKRNSSITQTLFFPIIRDTETLKKFPVASLQKLVMEKL